MLLTQLWDITDGPGVVLNKHGAQLLSGKSRFVPPQQWERWHLPFKLEVQGGITICSSLQRRGLVSGVILTSGGMIRLEVFNSTDSVVRITPKTQLVTLLGHSEVLIRRLAPVNSISSRAPPQSSSSITAASLAREIARDFADVGDLSQHPVVPRMQQLLVRADEVHWAPPQEQGQRTPFQTEQSSCRVKVSEQLDLYQQRGYLRRVSVGERVSLTPYCRSRSETAAIVLRTISGGLTPTSIAAA